MWSGLVPPWGHRQQQQPEGGSGPVKDGRVRMESLEKREVKAGEDLGCQEEQMRKVLEFF